MHDDDVIPDEELAQILARADAATPGPWTSYVEGRDHTSGSSFIMTGSSEARGRDIELGGASAWTRTSLLPHGKMCPVSSPRFSNSVAVCSDESPPGLQGPIDDGRRHTMTSTIQIEETIRLILDGEIDPVQGCRLLVQHGERLTQLAESEYLTIVAIESETDDLPAGHQAAFRN